MERSVDLRPAAHRAREEVMSELHQAAKEMLLCVDRMLRDGEWYAAQEKADALRTALAFDTYSDALANHRKVTHAENCWSWGPAHYECACAEVAKANGWKK
jgi:hypothetical protein